MGVTGFISLGAFINSRIYYKRNSCYEYIHNIPHRDASVDVNINLHCRDVSIDDCIIPLLRDTSRDVCRTSPLRDVSRDNSRYTILAMPL